MPGDVIPELYTLHLHPNLVERHFNGTNTISVKVHRRTNVIVLHSVGLDIQRVDFRTGNRYVLATYELIASQEFLRIQLAEYVEASNEIAELSIAFGGSLMNRIVGLYGSSYVNPAGQTR